VPQLAAILKSTGFDPKYLNWRSRERGDAGPDKVVMKLEALRRMGVRLAIDDFAPIFLARISEALPDQQPEVDRSFVRDLAHSSDDVAITRAVIAWPTAWA